MKVRQMFASVATCETAQAELEAYILEELPVRRAERITRHLALCASCREDFRLREEMFALVPQGLDPVIPPPEILENLLARVRKPERRPWTMAVGMTASAAAAALVMLLFNPLAATSLARALQSPDVAVINLFAVLDSPLSARYEYRTESHVRFDRSIGRILFNTNSNHWELAVHGLPRPPRGSRYVLSAWSGPMEHDLGTIERWEDGVATLKGRSEEDLTRMDRLSLELVSSRSRLRLLGAEPGFW